MESQKRNRHAELVDKKFRSLLTQAEQAELLQLQTQLDEADSKFYEPVEKKLELALQQITSAIERALERIYDPESSYDPNDPEAVETFWKNSTALRAPTRKPEGVTR